eukprot:Em0016g864a
MAGLKVHECAVEEGVVILEAVCFVNNQTCPADVSKEVSQEETGGEDVGGARGDKRHNKNASCVVESPKDDDIIMSEVELDKDMFQKPQKLYKKARKERGKECVIQLLEHKADIHKTAQNGGTPLYFACRHGQLKCVELLLQRGAKVVADRDGVTPLELCAQQGYSECIEVIIRFHPGQVENLLQLVCSEKIAENKVLPMMDYLCNSSRQMMTIVLSGLSQKVTTAGMELLSISSNYQDLMPQFPQGIRILSALYPTYIRAIKHSSSPITTSTPSLTTIPSTQGEVPDRASWSSYVHRVGSNGSVTERQLPRTSTVSSNASRGHHRSRSQTIMSSDLGHSVERSNTQPSSPRSKPSIPDPLQGLEMVWVSLESWFDLLVTEVQKVYQQDQDVMLSLGRLVLNTLGTPARVGVIAVGVSSGDKGEGVPSVTVISPNVGLTNTAEHSCSGGPRKDHPSAINGSHSKIQLRGEVKSGVISSGVGGANCTTSDEVPSSNMLAAAIVSSAPLQRRKAYLSNSRRSLHLERVAARLLSWQQDSSADPDGFGSDACFEAAPAVPPTVPENPTSPLTPPMPRPPGACAGEEPFEDRKKWFYENLYNGNEPSTELTLAAERKRSASCGERGTSSLAPAPRLQIPLWDAQDQLQCSLCGRSRMGAGVRREWFDSLSKEILNPDYALFTQSVDGYCGLPEHLDDCHSDVNPDHLSYFRFAGRLMGLAIYHQQLLSVYFTRSFYKHILGVPVDYRDVESIDPEYANNLQWLLDHEIDNLGLELTFSI